MSNWQSEFAYILRYAGSGALNTLVGFAVILLLMWLNIAPLIANICGYVVGLTLGFFVSKKYVFRSEGHFSVELVRYIAVFLTCFLLNLGILKISLDVLLINAYLAQLFAAAGYTMTMYLLTRRLVFRPRKNQDSA